jgi:hypothetical protein
MKTNNPLPEHVLAELYDPDIAGAYVLYDDMTWQAEGEMLPEVADTLNMLSQPPCYQYSLSHGAPGRMLAADLAERFGFQCRLQEVLPLPENAIS